MRGFVNNGFFSALDPDAGVDSCHRDRKKLCRESMRGSARACTWEGDQSLALSEVDYTCSFAALTEFIDLGLFSRET